MSNQSVDSFECNGRHYALPPVPVVVICIDGCADEYLDVTMARGLMPNLVSLSNKGFRGMARAALPSFTNVNNASIVTGVPPNIHGIPGNYFIDPDSSEEVMINSPKYLRAETILAKASQTQRHVAFITAKNKLLDIFSENLDGISFSSEMAHLANHELNGIDDVEALVGPKPEIYSADASVYVLKAGNALISKGHSDFLYLSLTDFMQHTYPPEAQESLDFYHALDIEIGKLIDAGAVIGITADHGMNGKTDAEDQPNVIYLESLLREKFDPAIRVILPITDPYVKHHGALGSYAVIHLPEGSNLDCTKIMNYIWDLQGITEVFSRPQAAAKLELPEDRLGDIVAMSARNIVIGSSPDQHDLSHLDAPLRSHGGRYEEMVPFIISHPLKPEYTSMARRDLRNFDIFDFTLNGTDLPPNQ